MPLDLSLPSHSLKNRIQYNKRYNNYYCVNTGYRENSIQNSIRSIRLYVYQDNVHQQGKFVRILNINFPFNSFPCL